MESYHKLLKDILAYGKERGDRTGTGTLGIFGYQFRHDLSKGFPLLTTKKVHFKSIVVELLWFLRGDTNIKFLHDHGVTIWDEWADANGDLGPVYGYQWRHWPKFDYNGIKLEIDQITNLIADLKAKPESRRHIVSAWNPVDVPKMALPPCHTLWQCYVSEGKLSLSLYARSIDSFLGLPFNIASYALLLSILAKECDYEPGELVISFGDLHIYSNHMDQVKEQLSRKPKELPQLVFEKKAIDEYLPTDFQIVGYDPDPAIKAPIAV